MKLAGAWRLLSCEHRYSDGRVTRPFGPKPLGRLIYSADGMMTVLLGDRGRPPCRSGQLFEATDAELARSARGFVAYSGRWELEGKQVVHHVDISLFPNWIGSRQLRLVELRGRRLTLSTNPFEVDGVRQTARLVWEREER